VRSGFGLTLVHAIFAGWLIALMVWLLPAAEANRVQVIVIVTYGVALDSFAHVIAGSIDVMYLAQVTASAGLAYSAASSSRRCSVTSLAARPSSLRSTSPRSLLHHRASPDCDCL